MSDDVGEQTSLDEAVNKYTESNGEIENSAKKDQELFGIGSIPRDWQVKEMSECVDITPGNSPPSSTYNESGDGLPFFQGNAEFGYFHPTADTWCSDPRKTAKTDDILMSIRAPVGDLNIADRECCIGRGLAGLRPTGVNGLYLYYSLAKRNAWLSRLATGSTFKSVTKSDLERLDLPLPPNQEQRKIASVLYNVDEYIQKTDEVIEQADKVKTGIMQDLFRNGIDNPETKDLRRIGQVPAHWNVVNLEEICTEITDGTHKSPPTIEEGYPYITSQNVRNWGFDLTDLKYISEEDHKRITSRCDPEKGDILYVKDGANTGNVNVNTLDFEFSLLSSVALIKPNRDRVKPWFLKYLFSWPKFRELTLSQMSGTGISRLTISKLEKTDVLLPPVSEQERIVDILDEYYSYQKNQRETRNQLQRLKNGLMQDLLAGVIRTVDGDINILPEVENYG